MEAEYTSFTALDIRVGTVLTAELFAEAINSAYKLSIDFGPLGVLKSSAQLTACYSADELVGRQVVAVVNFKPKQIANFMSQCLVLGALGVGDQVTLLSTERPVENGSRIA